MGFGDAYARTALGLGRSSGRYGVAYGVGGWRRAALQQVHTEEGTSKRSQMARDSQARAAAELFVCLFACLSGSASLVNSSRPMRAGGRNATNSSADGQARASGSGHHGIAFIPIKHSSVDCKVCQCAQPGFTVPEIVS